jgi:hypothetical protein
MADIRRREDLRIVMHRHYPDDGPSVGVRAINLAIENGDFSIDSIISIVHHVFSGIPYLVVYHKA